MQDRATCKRLVHIKVGKYADGDDDNNNII